MSQATLLKQPQDFYKKIDFEYGGLYSSSSKDLITKYKDSKSNQSNKQDSQDQQNIILH